METPVMAKNKVTYRTDSKKENYSENVYRCFDCRTLLLFVQTKKDICGVNENIKPNISIVEKRTYKKAIQFLFIEMKQLSQGGLFCGGSALLTKIAGGSHQLLSLFLNTTMKTLLHASISQNLKVLSRN